MRNFLLCVLFMLFQLQALQAQKLPDLAQKVAESEKVKPGFYLLKTTDGIISAEVEIIKRLGDGMFIVRLHENQGKEQLYKTGELYKVIRFGDSDWQLIQDPIDLKTEVFALNLQQASGTAQLRMTIGTREYLSEVFAIAPELFPEIAYNCDDEFRLVWEKV